MEEDENKDGEELEEFKRLGELAYNAYCNYTKWKSAITGAALPPFKETPVGVQNAWIASARALFNDFSNTYSAL